MNKELLKVLLQVQKDMPVVGKTTQAYNYKYAPIDHVWDVVKDVLQKNGFVIVNEIVHVVIQNAFEINGVKTTAIHELGELTSFIPFSSFNLEPKKRGSEITYARRYNLTAIFNIIVAGEDDDASSTKPTTVADPTDDWAKPDDVCVEHGTPYREFNKNGRTWSSHKIEGTDIWCNKK